MTHNLYEQLAEALNRLPNGFPRTPSNVEIPLLKKIFSPEEATLASQLCRELEPVEVIAKRVGLPVKEARARLMQMVKRGLVWFDKQAGKPRFRLAPFIVGIYEAQLESMDHELAHLVEKFMADGGPYAYGGRCVAMGDVVDFVELFPRFFSQCFEVTGA